VTDPADYRSASRLHYPKEVQDDEDDGEDDQQMNPTAGFREAGADVSTEEAKQPEHNQDYDDSPQHGPSPFIWLSDSYTSVDQAG
jgi:hypothetical protein